MPQNEELVHLLEEVIAHLGENREGTAELLTKIFARMVASETLVMELRAQVEKDYAKDAADQLQRDKDRDRINALQQQVWSIYIIVAGFVGVFGVVLLLWAIRQ